MGPDGKYRDLVLKERDGVLCHRSLLGLELCLEGERLFYRKPARGVRLLTPSELYDARKKAEEARRDAEAERGREARLRRKETAARQAAEARIAELERKLRAG